MASRFSNASTKRARWSHIRARALLIARMVMAGRSPRVRYMVGLALNGILLALLGVLLYQNQQYLPLIVHVFTPRIVGASFVLYLVSLLIQFWIWMNLMDYRAGERLRALDEYIRTIFLGRLPGGLWKIIGRMTVYRAPRLSSKEIVVVNLIEIGLMLLACGLILLSLIAPDLLRWTVGATASFALLFVMSLWSARLLPRLHRVRWIWNWLGWLGGYIGSWLCGGLIVYLVVLLFDAHVSFARVMIAWCIAGAAGLVLQVLPLSVLIRDATLAGLLQGTMPLSKAIVAAFAVRLMMMICELGAGWALLLLAQPYRRILAWVSPWHRKQAAHHPGSEQP